jgi:uncharacterized protein YcbX
VSVPAGTISALWRFPVKSMQGERLDSAGVTAAGITGDRAYGIVDTSTGKVASAKQPKLWPDLLDCRATFLAEPQLGEAPPPARIELADGTVVRTDAPDVDAVLSRWFGRPVTLTTAAPANFLIDNYEPDTGAVLTVAAGAAVVKALGLPAVLPETSLMDAFPLTMLTTSALRHFSELEPGSQWDQRRFRMNVIIETPGQGLVENAWVGGQLTIGDGVTLAVAVPTPRCVMTTLAVQELPKDSRILKAAAAHNRIDFASFGKYPCVGIYAIPATSGTISTGDEVGITR